MIEKGNLQWHMLLHSWHIQIFFCFFIFSWKGENIAILKTQDVNEVLIKGK
jgi:hypothetical protein